MLKKPNLKLTKTALQNETLIPNNLCLPKKNCSIVISKNLILYYSINNFDLRFWVCNSDLIKRYWIHNALTSNLTCHHSPKQKSARWPNSLGPSSTQVQRTRGNWPRGESTLGSEPSDQRKAFDRACRIDWPVVCLQCRLAIDLLYSSHQPASRWAWYTQVYRKRPVKNWSHGDASRVARNSRGALPSGWISTVPQTLPPLFFPSCRSLVHASLFLRTSTYRSEIPTDFHLTFNLDFSDLYDAWLISILLLRALGNIWQLSSSNLQRNDGRRLCPVFSFLRVTRS